MPAGWLLCRFETARAPPRFGRDERERRVRHRARALRWDSRGRASRPHAPGARAARALDSVGTLAPALHAEDHRRAREAPAGRPRSGPSPPVGGVGFSAESRRRALAVCVSIRQRCASPSVSAGTPRSEHGGLELMRTDARVRRSLLRPRSPSRLDSAEMRGPGTARLVRSRELGRGWFSAESRRSAEMPAPRASPRAWRRSRFGRDAPDREKGRRGRASGPTPPWEWTKGSS